MTAPSTPVLGSSLGASRPDQEEPLSDLASPEEVESRVGVGKRSWAPLCRPHQNTLSSGCSEVRMVGRCETVL
jgi:hypothetical protein